MEGYSDHIQKHHQNNQLLAPLLLCNSQLYTGIQANTPEGLLRIPGQRRLAANTIQQASTLVYVTAQSINKHSFLIVYAKQITYLRFQRDNLVIHKHPVKKSKNSCSFSYRTHFREKAAL